MGASDGVYQEEKLLVSRGSGTTIVSAANTGAYFARNSSKHFV
jgi:hypothetical protein